MSTPSGSTVSVTFSGSWSDTDPCPPIELWYEWGYSAVTENVTAGVFRDTDSGFFNRTATIDSDRSVRRRAKAQQSCGASASGSTITAKTDAMLATASTPASSLITASSATISCDFLPNTNASTATAQMQYRAFGSGTWIDAGSASVQTGYTTKSASANLTGLSGSTTYEFRLNGTRTTNNGTTFTSSTQTFTTAAAAPEVTTTAATGVTSTTATFNGTVDPNGFSTDVTFQYGITSGVYILETSPAETFTVDGVQTVAKLVTGGSASTTYYYRTKGVYSGGTVFGSELSFTTAPDPNAESLLEDHMHIYQFDRKYGVQSTVYFTLSSPAATSSDRLVTTAPGSLFAAGDIKISKDGAAYANVANSVTQLVASNPTYSLVLTAAEMQATDILIQIVDQNGPAFRDALIHVRTKMNLGQIDVDATQIGSNTPGMTVTGVGTSPGILAAGGSTSSGDITGTLTNHIIRRSTATAGAASSITLDASASATNDFYNNSVILIVSGTGAGQYRVISDYDGGTKVATVNRSWATNPASGSVFLILPADDVWNISPLVELSAIPSATSTFAGMLQATFQRFFYKRTQTSTTQTLFKADSSTTLGSATVSDDGTTQSSGKIS